MIRENEIFISAILYFFRSWAVPETPLYDPRTVPFSTQVYEWVLALQWTSRFMLSGASEMGHLASASFTMHMMMMIINIFVIIIIIIIIITIIIIIIIINIVSFIGKIINEYINITAGTA